MSDRPVNLSAGLPETVLPPAPPEAEAALAAAVALPDVDAARAAVAEVVRAHPRFLAGWAALGELARDDIEAYAYFRIGYHRGLDALRGAGWRGSGYVRSTQPSNRGFLAALAGLGRLAEKIGEQDEAERIALFLQQLDPR